MRHGFERVAACMQEKWASTHNDHHVEDALPSSGSLCELLGVAELHGERFFRVPERASCCLGGRVHDLLSGGVDLQGCAVDFTVDLRLRVPVGVAQEQLDAGIDRVRETRGL